MANHPSEFLFNACTELRQEHQSQMKSLADFTPGKNERSFQADTPAAVSSLGNFMDLLPIPIVLVDRSYKIRFMNSATATICGDYSGILGQDISRLFPRRSDYQDVKAFLENMACCGHAQIREGEMQILSNKVNCRIFLSSTSVEGEEFTMLAVEDCALLRKTSILIEECRTLLTAVPAGAAHFELTVPVSIKTQLSACMSSIMNARLKTANEQFALMHGFAGVDELRGALAAEFVLPFSPMEAAFRAWVERGLPIYKTKLNADSSGQDASRTEVVLAANITDGKLISYWLVERSLENRIKMQTLLGSVGGRFQTVFERVDDLILMKDLDSRYLEVNPPAQRLLKIDRDAIKGKTPEDVWGVETGRKIRECDGQASQGLTSDQILTLRSSENIKVHLTCTPMRDLAGNIIGLFEIGHVVHSPWPSPKVSCQDSSSSQKDCFPVCRSDAMHKTLETVWVAAKTEGMILLTGETGSGKDFLAELIHKSSARAAKPFISINCAAVPVELAESELFGHEPGAFTGAKKQKKGMLEMAHGGTLLMNEIGDLPLPLQAKLLTFLDTNSFCRVGGTKSIAVDARIIAATNRPLPEDIAEGRFRQDLFYRLNVLSIVVPPLRERREDLPQLIKQILSQLACRIGSGSIPQLSPSLMTALLDYDWPGNVRELKSVLQRVLILSEAGEVTAKSLGLEEASGKWGLKTLFPKGRSLNEVLDDVKFALIEEALKRTGGKRQEAAKLLGISRNSLKHHMRLHLERKRSPARTDVGPDNEIVTVH